MAGPDRGRRGKKTRIFGAGIPWRKLAYDTWAPMHLLRSAGHNVMLSEDPGQGEDGYQCTINPLCGRNVTLAVCDQRQIAPVSTTQGEFLGQRRVSNPLNSLTAADC